MSNIVVQRAMADLVTAKIGSAFSTGGAVVGGWIDRFDTGSLPLNAALLIPFAVTGAVAVGSSVTFGPVAIEHSDDGDAAEPYMTIADVSVPGPIADGGGGVVKLAIPLGAAKRFVRMSFTAGAGVTSAVAVWNLAGFDRLPAQ